MPEYFYHSLIQNPDNLERDIEVAVLFRHYFPGYFKQWQDKLYGSVAIIQVLHPRSLTPLVSLSTTHLRKIERGCWNYLHNHQLLNKENIVAFKCPVQQKSKSN